MRSTPTDADRSTASDAPLSAVADWHSVLPVPRHPIQAWIDLMEVVEALCPVWPQRVMTIEAGNYRL